MIYCSAGHNPQRNNQGKIDPGAVGCNKLHEADLTVIQRDLTCEQLSELNCPFIKDKNSESLSEYLRRIQPGTGSVLLEYHFNAFNGKASGVETIVADNANQNSRNFAKELNDVTAKILNLPNRGVKEESKSARGRLGFMRNPGTCALIELCFIDNCFDVKSWETNNELLAKEHARIIKKYEDLV